MCQALCWATGMKAIGAPALQSSRAGGEEKLEHSMMDTIAEGAPLHAQTGKKVS